ncbi:MAG TPA: Glu/Leu/Phe/Val dehydrogenase dimerization domain-containing protein, partial [Terriglobales bacterium]|nr:Glu/Leu/Phe/Val dehydrogenase dimerization domain-containing protein [Terriglobales bacterium]
MAAGSMAESFSRDTTPELEAAQQLEEAGRFLDLEKWILQRLRYGERETQLHLQVTNDSGEPRIVRATRAQHSSVRGPGMGPLVFSKHLSTADINALAMNLTWQWALWKLPFSGAAGVVGAEVEELSEREARLLTRCYVGQLRGTIGPQLDVITPARGSHPEIMAWALSALGTADGRTLATITGKP